MSKNEQFLTEKVRLLERGLRAAAAKCSLRLIGLCQLECPARAFCDVSGLMAISVNGGREARK